MAEYVPADTLPDSTVVDRQPIGVGAAVLGVTNTVLTLLVVFGVELSGEQVAAIYAAVNSVLILVGAVWAWRRVTPVRRVS